MSFLPYPPTSTTAAIEVFRQDVAITHEVVHGGDTESVLTENGTIPTIAKFIKDSGDRIDSEFDDIDALKAAAAADIGSARVSAISASASAATAQAAATTASNAASFKGNWSSLTGAYSVPSVVYHNGLYWQLITNTTNITLDQPSVSNKWVLADLYSQQQFIESINKKFTTRLIFDKNQHFKYEKYGLTAKPITDILTTSRSTTAIYNTPDGVAIAAVNEPRIEYDPTTGECLGLIAEESVVNLALNSQVITASTGTVLVSSNSVVAPDGTTTADVIGETTANGEHYCSDRGISIVAGNVYVWSCFVKRFSGSSSKVIMRLAAGSNPASKTFNIEGQDFTDSTGGLQSYPDGWKRVWLITPSITTTGTGVFRLQFSNSDNNIVYAGTETEQFAWWGAQLEASSFPTSYIPTTTSAVTRVGDNYSFPCTYLSEFTLYFCFDNRKGDTSVIGGIGDTFDNCTYLTIGNWSIRVGGLTIAPIPAGTTTGVNKVALSVKSGQIIAVRNGAVAGTNASTYTGKIPTSRFKLLSAPWEVTSGPNIANGTIMKDCGIIPRALSALEMQQLTRLL